MPAKNNAMRVLDQRKVAYEVFEYSPDLHSAEEAAQVMGALLDHVYKTIVVLRERGKPLLVMTPGDQEIDLRILAKSIGEKKLRLATHHEAEELTGLQTGGISALALLNRGFDVYAARQITDLDFVHVSAGQRGLNLRLKPADLIAVTRARLVDVAE